MQEIKNSKLKYLMYSISDLLLDPTKLEPIAPPTLTVDCISLRKSSCCFASYKISITLFC